MRIPGTGIVHIRQQRRLGLRQYQETADISQALAQHIHNSGFQSPIKYLAAAPPWLHGGSWCAPRSRRSERIQAFADRIKADEPDLNCSRNVTGEYRQLGVVKVVSPVWRYGAGIYTTGSGIQAR